MIYAYKLLTIHKAIQMQSNTLLLIEFNGWNSLNKGVHFSVKGICIQ